MTDRKLIGCVQHDCAVCKARLAQPEPPPECKTDEEKTAFAFGWLKAMEAQRLAQPEQEPVKLRRGTILRCTETDELCTVWATSTTGKTLVKWSANNFGNYTAEQIGDLFWLEPKPEQEPVAYEYGDAMCPPCNQNCNQGRNCPARCKEKNNG